jgi:hypothetical protein
VCEFRTFPVRAACPANLLLFGGLLREHVVTVVALTVMPLHGASAGGPCWCRPAVGPTTVPPVQRRLGIHHAVGGSCPPGHYNSPQVNGWSSPSGNGIIRTRLQSGGRFCQLTVSDMLLVAHRHLSLSTSSCFHDTDVQWDEDISGTVNLGLNLTHTCTGLHHSQLLNTRRKFLHRFTHHEINTERTEFIFLSNEKRNVTHKSRL